MKRVKNTCSAIYVNDKYSGGIHPRFEELVQFTCLYKSCMIKVDNHGFPGFINFVSKLDVVSKEKVLNDKDFLFEQLDCIVSNQDFSGLFEIEKDVFVTNVYLLTKHGLLKNSEFSGMSLVYLGRT